MIKATFPVKLIRQAFNEMLSGLNMILCLSVYSHFGKIINYVNKSKSYFVNSTAGNNSYYCINTGAG